MPHGEETERFERLLKRRGTGVEGNAEIEREIFERYQDHCAVLVLDSSGFTRLTQTHGIIHFLALVVDMRSRLLPVFQQHGALMVWFEADNLYAVFPEALPAVQAALAAQLTMAEANNNRSEEERLDICVGIGAGRLLRIGTENIYGHQMNLASKLGEDCAESGDVLITEDAWNEIADHVDGLYGELRTVRVSGVDIPYRKLKLGCDAERVTQSISRLK